jgi:hypothetical protein
MTGERWMAKGKEGSDHIEIASASMEIIWETNETTRIVRYFGLGWQELNPAPRQYEAWVKKSSCRDVHFENAGVTSHQKTCTRNVYPYMPSACTSLEIVKCFQYTIIAHLNCTYKYGTAQFTNRISCLHLSLSLSLPSSSSWVQRSTFDSWPRTFCGRVAINRAGKDIPTQPSTSNLRRPRIYDASSFFNVGFRGRRGIIKIQIALADHSGRAV